MFDKNKVKIGIHSVGWTNDDLPELGAHISFEQCIKEMAAAGYQGCEVGNKFPKDPAVCKQKLQQYGLSVCNEWFATYFTTRPYEENIERLYAQIEKMKALGAKIIGGTEQGHSIQCTNQPIFKKGKPIYTEKEWELISRGFNEMGEIARKNDMYLAIHHHMGTGVQSEEEIDKLMKMTDPKYVFLLFCIGHVKCAGIDPGKLLEKHVCRVKHVHLKDVRPKIRRQAIQNDWSFLEAVKAGIFTIPGDGCVDYDPLFKLLEKNNYEGWLLVEAEQDPEKAPSLEYAMRARRYVFEHTGL